MHNLIFVFAWIGSFPNQQQVFNDLPQRRAWTQREYARYMSISCQVFTQVLWHRAPVTGNQMI